MEMQHQQVPMCERLKDWEKNNTLPESEDSHAANVYVQVFYFLAHILVLWSAFFHLLPVIIHFQIFFLTFFKIKNGWSIRVNPCTFVLFLPQLDAILASHLLCEGKQIFKNSVTPQQMLSCGLSSSNFVPQYIFTCCIIFENPPHSYTRGLTKAV